MISKNLVTIGTLGALALAGCGSSKPAGTTAAPSTPPHPRAADAAAQAIVRTAQTAAETIAVDANGEYTGVTPAAIRKLVSVPSTPGTSGYLSTAAGTSATYELTAASASGDTFTITRRSNGAVAHTCAGHATSLCNNGKW